MAAEQLYLWLAERQSPGEVLDLLLPGFISRNYRDDHNFLYPVFTARALDDIGWEWAPVLMRPIVRYQARTGGDLSGGETSGFKAVEDVVEEYALLDMDIPLPHDGGGDRGDSSPGAKPSAPTAASSTTSI